MPPTGRSLSAPTGCIKDALLGHRVEVGRIVRFPLGRVLAGGGRTIFWEFRPNVGFGRIIRSIIQTKREAQSNRYMANNFDRLRLFSGDEWMDQMRPDKPDEIDTYVDDDDESFHDDDLDLTVPDVLGILPIRNTVVYPGTVTHLAVGRERSKALLKDTEPNETVIGLLTQRNPDTDRPEFGDLYSVGTTASVLKTIKMPQGSINIVVHGIGRFRIVQRVATRPYLKAKVRMLHVRTKMTKQLQALAVRVLIRRTRPCASRTFRRIRL